jgi:Yersinia/Haemophilus virulence surface antigen
MKLSDVGRPWISGKPSESASATPVKRPDSRQPPSSPDAGGLPARRLRTTPNLSPEAPRARAAVGELKNFLRDSSGPRQPSPLHGIRPHQKARPAPEAAPLPSAPRSRRREPEVVPFRQWSMPYDLKRHLVSGMNQGWAMKHQFGEAGQQNPGICAGLSAVWMQVHRAHPQVRADCRTASMMSLEGMSHALIFQNSYHAHWDDGNNSRGKRNSSWKWWRPTKPVLDETRKNIDEMYGIERSERFAAETPSDEKIAEALRKIDGYATLTYSRVKEDGKASGHEMAVYARQGEGKITLFDPNYGEFNVTHEELPQLIRELRATCSAKNDKSFEWQLRPAEIKKTIDDTPLANLAEDVGARQEKFDDLWNKRR